MPVLSGSCPSGNRPVRLRIPDGTGNRNLVRTSRRQPCPTGFQGFFPPARSPGLGHSRCQVQAILLRQRASFLRRLLGSGPAGRGLEKLRARREIGLARCPGEPPVGRCLDLFREREHLFPNHVPSKQEKRNEPLLLHGPHRNGRVSERHFARFARHHRHLGKSVPHDPVLPRPGKRFRQKIQRIRGCLLLPLLPERPGSLP